MEKEDNILQPNPERVNKIFNQMVRYVNKETPRVELENPSMVTIKMYSDSDDILFVNVDVGLALNIKDTRILESMISPEYFREITKVIDRGFKYSMSKSNDEGKDNVKALFLKIQKKYNKKIPEKEDNTLQERPEAQEVSKIFDKMILYANKETLRVELERPSLITVEMYSNSDDIFSVSVDLCDALNIYDETILKSMIDKKYFTDIIRRLPSTFNYSMGESNDKEINNVKSIFIKITQ